MTKYEQLQEHLNAIKALGWLLALLVLLALTF